MIKKAMKAVVAAAGAGAASALVVLEAGSQGDVKSWLLAAGMSFLTGVGTYFAKNAA